MIKTKSKEIMKVVAVSVLSIGVLSAAFVWLNNQTFARATNGGESMRFITTLAASAPTVAQSQQEATESLQARVLQIEVQENDGGHTPLVINPDEAAQLVINPDEAAQLGAQYMWDMFEECIDGKFVAMRHIIWPSHTRTYWKGIVADSREAYLENLHNFSFLIDAVTGERIDARRVRDDILEREAARDAISEQLMEIENEMNAGGTLGYTIFDTVYNMRTGLQTPEQLNAQSQIAKSIAQRHFISSYVESAVFLSFGTTDLNLDESGNVTISQRLNFSITDSTGRVALLSFAAETGKLYDISTQHNDVVPGFGGWGNIVDTP